MKPVSRGVTAGETSGVKSIFRENTSVAVDAKKNQQIISQMLPGRPSCY